MDLFGAILLRWLMSCSFSHTLLIYVKCKDTLYVCCLLFQWELFIPVIDDVTECNAPINTYVIVMNKQVTSIEFLSFGQVLCRHFLQICISLFFNPISKHFEGSLFLLYKIWKELPLFNVICLIQLLFSFLFVWFCFFTGMLL